jgi:CBS domain-containing protein
LARLDEIMTRKVFTTSGDATLVDVAKEMVKGRFGSAIVMQGPWIAGIFTERDVLRAAAAGADPNSAAVSEWMTKDPVTVAGDMDSEEAGQIMVTQGFRHLPVVEGKEVVGIVSLRDILTARRRSG